MSRQSQGNFIKLQISSRLGFIIRSFAKSFDICWLSSLQVPSGDTDLLLFAGQTSSSSTIVLVSLGLVDTKLTVNTDNIVLGSMIMKEIKTALEKCWFQNFYYNFSSIKYSLWDIVLLQLQLFIKLFQSKIFVSKY